MSRIEVDIPKEAKDDFGRRWLLMMQSRETGEISSHELRRIIMNVVAHQHQTKVLRRDRHVLREDSPRSVITGKGAGRISIGDFKTRDTALVLNQSDAAILDEMEELEREAGLDMSDTEQSWHDYIIGVAA